MKYLLGLIYAGVAAISVAVAFDFIGEATDWIFLVAFTIFTFGAFLPDHKVQRLIRNIIMPATIVAVAVSLAWWNMWLYSGVVGSPNIIHPVLANFVVIDGECSYDAELVEMYILSLTTSLVAFSGVAKLNSRRQRERDQKLTRISDPVS